MTSRTTRSRSKLPSIQQTDTTITSSSDSKPAYKIPDSIISVYSGPAKRLSSTLTRKQTRLDQASHTLLLRKQRLLQALDLPQTHTEQECFVSQSTSSRNSKATQLQPAERTGLVSAVSSTLIFAQEGAGTAVCIHESGLVLTCAHCVAESREELEQNYGTGKDGPLWLLTATGAIALARCVAWDERRDLALLSIIAAQTPRGNAGHLHVDNDGSTSRAHDSSFANLRISSSWPALNTGLVCIGQPGAEDMEAAMEGTKAGYPILAMSRGRFLGYAPDQDIQDNSDIGALCHDAWTYWGHSGAPLVDCRAGGRLIGLHSSWDDSTGTRRGVGVESIQGFLTEVDEVLSNGKTSEIFVSNL